MAALLERRALDYTPCVAVRPRGFEVLPPMMAQIRAFAKSPVANVLLALLLISFVIFGVRGVSTQVGATEWYDGTNIERVSFFQSTSSGGLTFDAWPTNYPASSNPFTGTITTLYFYNFSAAASAVMQATVILT